MRRLLFSVLTVCALALGACSGDQGKAESAGERFMQAWAVDYDYSEIAKYAAGEAREKIRNEYEQVGADSLAVMRKDMRKIGVRFEPDKEHSIIGTVNAMLCYKLMSQSRKDLRVDLEMRCKRGRWMVVNYYISTLRD